MADSSVPSLRVPVPALTRALKAPTEPPSAGRRRRPDYQCRCGPRQCHHGLAVDIKQAVPGTAASHLGRGRGQRPCVGRCRCYGALAVRKATLGNLSSADGDYEPLQMSAGKLWVVGAYQEDVVADRSGETIDQLGRALDGVMGEPGFREQRTTEIAIANATTSRDLELAARNERLLDFDERTRRENNRRFPARLADKGDWRHHRIYLRRAGARPGELGERISV